MANNINTMTLLWALIGGILPAVFWLWFWLREDRLHPEPRRKIISSFLAGMLSVLFAFVAEHFAFNLIKNQSALIFSWAAIEEIAKFVAVYIIAFKDSEFDEPLDAMIYMITGALGFAAIENFLFIINSQNIFVTFMTTSMRFVGATLLHTITSATIGAAIALSFYRRKLIKEEYLAIGLVIATFLHTLFNFFIIKDDGKNILLVFSVLWTLAILMILIFEKVKQIKNRPPWNEEVKV